MGLGAAGAGVGVDVDDADGEVDEEVGGVVVVDVADAVGVVVLGEGRDDADMLDKACTFFAMACESTPSTLEITVAFSPKTHKNVGTTVISNFSESSGTASASTVRKVTVEKDLAS